MALILLVAVADVDGRNKSGQLRRRFAAAEA
jgi:hypothetical protein